MAALWWNSEVRHLSEALGNLGELKNVAKNELATRLHFTDVRSNELEVAGGKNGCWVSIAHFHIADRQFWEVVMCSGDAAETARTTTQEVVTMLRGLRFL